MKDNQLLEVSKVATITMPPGFYTETAGTWFIDGFSFLADSLDYGVGALVGSPTASPAMGVLALFRATSKPQFEFHAAPQGSSSWPSGGSITAACTMNSSGLVAFATVDEGVRVLQVHNSVLSAAKNWDLYAQMVFDGRPGPVQCMIEKDGTIFGFIKSTPPTQNAFFIARPNEKPELIYYDGPAAAAQFPTSSGSPDNSFMLRRIAAAHNKIYVIDETHSNVLCASMGGVTTFPLSPPVSPTASCLIMSEYVNKAYCQYTIGAATENVYEMLYDVTDTGLQPEPNSVNVGGKVCPSFDQGGFRLYTIPQYGTPALYYMGDNKPIPIGGDPLPSQSSGLVGFPGTWADSQYSVLYISGVADFNGDPSNVSAYKIY